MLMDPLVKKKQSGFLINEHVTSPTCVCLCYLSQVCEVRFVSHEHHWRVHSAPHTADELLEVASLLEAAPVRYGVRNDEAFASTHVLITHGCEFSLRAHAHTHTKHFPFIISFRFCGSSAIPVPVYAVTIETIMY